VPERRYAKLLEVFRRESGRTVSSISFSRKTASYFPRPRLRSQTNVHDGAPIRVAAHHGPCLKGCLPGYETTGHFTSRWLADWAAEPRSLMSVPHPMVLTH
jgi:hypothetical protein